MEKSKGFSWWVVVIAGIMTLVTGFLMWGLLFNKEVALWEYEKKYKKAIEALRIAEQERGQECEGPSEDFYRHARREVDSLAYAINTIPLTGENLTGWRSYSQKAKNGYEKNKKEWVLSFKDPCSLFETIKNFSDFLHITRSIINELHVVGNEARRLQSRYEQMTMVNVSEYTEYGEEEIREEISCWMEDENQELAQPLIRLLNQLLEFQKIKA